MREAGNQQEDIDPREQELLADVADLISCIIEAAPFRAVEQAPEFRMKQLRGPREKSLAAKHIAARAFQKALYGGPSFLSASRHLSTVGPSSSGMIAWPDHSRAYGNVNACLP